MSHNNEVGEVFERLSRTRFRGFCPEACQRGQIDSRRFVLQPVYLDIWILRCPLLTTLRPLARNRKLTKIELHSREVAPGRLYLWT